MRTGAEAKAYIERMRAEGAVPIKPQHIPEWEGLSDAERQTALERRFREEEAGVRLDGPVRSTPPAAESGDPSDLFNPDDPSSILAGRAERYRMPNGKWVWVHPCSLEEATVINARAIRITAERRGLGAVGDMGWMSVEVNREIQQRGQAMQVIHCCRKGQDATSPPIFDPLKHTDWLMREPGYVDAIQDICKLSDALGQGESEAKLLKEAMLSFFARLQRFAETWRGRLSEDSAPTLLPEFCDRLEDCAASASSMKQPEAFCPEAWFAWNIVLRDAPTPEEINQPSPVIVDGEPAPCETAWVVPVQSLEQEGRLCALEPEA